MAPEQPCTDAPSNFCGAMGTCIRHFAQNVCKCRKYFGGHRCQEFDLDLWYSHSGTLSSIHPPDDKCNVEEFQNIIAKLSVVTARIDSYHTTMCLGITYGVILCLLILLIYHFFNQKYQENTKKNLTMGVQLTTDQPQQSLKRKGSSIIDHNLTTDQKQTSLVRTATAGRHMRSYSNLSLIAPNHNTSTNILQKDGNGNLGNRDRDACVRDRDNEQNYQLMHNISCENLISPQQNNFHRLGSSMKTPGGSFRSIVEEVTKTSGDIKKSKSTSASKDNLAD